MLNKLKRKLMMAMFDVNSIEAEVQAELATNAHAGQFYLEIQAKLQEIK